MDLLDEIGNLSQRVAELEKKAAHAKILANNTDVFFLVVMAIIIYFMQCGFAFLECGAVRSKNSTNILIKNVLDSFVAGFAYWIIGFPLAFGSSESNNNNFIGTMYWAHHDMPENLWAVWFFQMVFAATAATIVSGAMAERCDFPAYLAYSFFLTGFMYPVVTHWAWDPYGWLKMGSQGVCRECPGDTNCTLLASECFVGYKDFAGSGVVHLFGGFAALAGAFLLGPRYGRFNEFGDPQPIRGHSVPLAALGGFILFLGFFAFNGGSQGRISEAGDGTAVAVACINTIISAAFSAFVCLIANRVWADCTSGDKHWSLLQAINGALAGMVAICAGCDAVYTWGAACIGTVSGISYMFWSWAMLKLKIDDPLDAFAVHVGGGLWGVLAAPIFRKDGILFYWDRFAFLAWGWNMAGAAAISLWSFALAAILFGILKLIGLLRVPLDYEINGLDIPKHGEPAYPVDSYGHGWGERGDTLISLAKILTKNSSLALGALHANNISRSVDQAAAIASTKRYEHAETHARGRKQLDSAFPIPESKTLYDSLNKYGNVAGVKQPNTVVMTKDGKMLPEIRYVPVRQDGVVYKTTDLPDIQNGVVYRTIDVPERPTTHVVPANRPMHITVTSDPSPPLARQAPVGETIPVDTLMERPQTDHSYVNPAYDGDNSRL